MGPAGPGAGLPFPSRPPAGYPTQAVKESSEGWASCHMWMDCSGWYYKLPAIPAMAQMGADPAGRQGTIVIKLSERGEEGPLSTMDPISIWRYEPVADWHHGDPEAGFIWEMGVD